MADQTWLFVQCFSVVYGAVFKRITVLFFLGWETSKKLPQLEGIIAKDSNQDPCPISYLTFNYISRFPSNQRPTVIKIYCRGRNFITYYDKSNQILSSSGHNYNATNAPVCFVFERAFSTWYRGTSIQITAKNIFIQLVLLFSAAFCVFPYHILWSFVFVFFCIVVFLVKRLETL